MKNPFLLLLAVAGAVFAAARRRHSQAGTDIWREATSDTSR
ncbi:MAG: DLW-39 family protein [Jatrophihabitantaceae bacterium]